MASFGCISEGISDFHAIESILSYQLNLPNLNLRQLAPLDQDPGGWPQVLSYLEKEDFQAAFGFLDYIIVQIDTDIRKDNTFKDKHPKDLSGVVALSDLVQEFRELLIGCMGAEVFERNKEKILFAVCVEQMECWLLPFVSEDAGTQAKVSGCAVELHRILNADRELPLSKGKPKLIQECLKAKRKLEPDDVRQRFQANPSLKIFIGELERCA